MKKLFTSGIIFGLSLLALSPAYAENKTDKEAFKKMLIEVLNENPDILFDIMQKNNEEFIKTITNASKSVRENELSNQWQKDIKVEKKFVSENRPTLGNENASNTIYIFSDFLCSYCQKSAQIVESFIQKHDDVKLVFKAYPKNEAGKLAMRWFYYLNQKDSKKAWQLHDTIFVHQQAFAASPLTVLKEIVRQQGFDAEDITKEVEKNKASLDAMINQDLKEVKKYNIQGTPYMFINNLVLIGAQDLATLESALNFSKK